MSPIIAKKFKAIFEEQKQSLVYSHQIVNESFHIQPDDLRDELDLSTTELETNMRMRLRNREALFLKKIDEALDRITAGTFGHCEHCEEPIEPKRLEIQPTAEYCIRCKEAQELQEEEPRRRGRQADGGTPCYHMERHYPPGEDDEGRREGIERVFRDGQVRIKGKN